mmetsp:Transcript_3510/g.8868  ORF Transcript_3510/g.8868 Transcript_3510/m.8868 type:complete len:245 (+) Transcript_3510:339-1073(+)
MPTTLLTKSARLRGQVASRWRRVVRGPTRPAYTGCWRICTCCRSPKGSAACRTLTGDSSTSPPKFTTNCSPLQPQPPRSATSSTAELSPAMTVTVLSVTSTVSAKNIHFPFVSWSSDISGMLFVMRSSAVLPSCSALRRTRVASRWLIEKQMLLSPSMPAMSTPFTSIALAQKYIVWLVPAWRRPSLNPWAMLSSRGDTPCCNRLAMLERCSSAASHSDLKTCSPVEAPGQFSLGSLAAQTPSE